MSRLTILFAIGLAAILSPRLSAQGVAADIPSEVVRRMTQAIWPDELFDSAGRPERPILRESWRAWRPGFDELTITAQPLSSSRLRNIRLYRGDAGYWRGTVGVWDGVRRAAAESGGTYFTLAQPRDLGRVLAWAQPLYGRLTPLRSGPR